MMRLWNKNIYLFGWIGWAIAIFIFSSIPGESLPDLSLWSKDKLIHAGVYALLTFLGIRALQGYSWPQKRIYFYVFVLNVFYALTDELHQYFVPNRSCEFYDWLADVAGVMMMIGIMIVFSHRIKMKIN